VETTRYSSTKAEQEIKLFPNFELVKYKVGKKKGYAVLIQDQEGDIKCSIRPYEKVYSARTLPRNPPHAGRE